MPEWIIWHNPRCSKSRQVLKILEDSDVKFKIVDYQKTPPTEKEISQVLGLLQINPSQLVRTKESLYGELNLKGKSETDHLTALSQNPKLIERPVVFNQKKAAIGRPPENIQELIK